MLRIKLQNQKWHCPKQYHTRMKEKISILAKCSVFMVMMFQIYFWSTNEYSHTDPLSHARQNFTIKSSSKNPPGNRSKSPVVPPDVIKSPKKLPAVKKKAVLLISRYRNQFIMIQHIMAGYNLIDIILNSNQGRKLVYREYIQQTKRFGILF